MSLRCAACRARLYALSAGQASDADRLEVETHLAGCAACRQEQSRWLVIGALGAHDPRLSTAQRERMRERVMAAAQASRPPARPARSVPRGLVLAAASLAVVAAASVEHFQTRPPLAEVVAGEVRIGERAAAPGTAITDGARLSSERGGEVRLDGPDLVLAPGTTMAWSREARAVTLESGDVTVDVTPGQGRGFRVATPRFAAVVVGTRFVVTMASVSTQRGSVRVVGSDGAELAMVRAGETWRAAEPPGAAAAEIHFPTPPPVAATVQSPPSSSPVEASAPVDHANRSRAASTARGEPSVRALLEQAKRALASGDTGKARGLLEQVLAAHPHRSLLAEARLLFVDSLRVDGRRDEAIRGYREVAGRFGHLPEAESALWFAAELELEASRRDEARRGFADYLARYPRGQFRAEAETRLARLGPLAP